MRMRFCPAPTRSPSWTRISATMPGSRLCTTCTWLDGMMRPAPVAIWSTWATEAHSTPSPKTAAMTSNIRHAPSVTEDSMTARGSLAKLRSTSAIGAAFLPAGSVARSHELALHKRRQHLVPRPIRRHAAVLQHDQPVDQLQHRDPVGGEDQRRVRLQPVAEATDESGLG